MVEQLGAAVETLGRIGELTDSQLDQVPPKDSFRFCDGQRTFEQVLAGLLSIRLTRPRPSRPRSPERRGRYRARHLKERRRWGTAARVRLLRFASHPRTRLTATADAGTSAREPCGTPSRAGIGDPVGEVETIP